MKRLEFLEKTVLVPVAGALGIEFLQKDTQYYEMSFDVNNYRKGKFYFICGGNKLFPSKFGNRHYECIMQRGDGEFAKHIPIGSIYDDNFEGSVFNICVKEFKGKLRPIQNVNHICVDASPVGACSHWPLSNTEWKKVWRDWE